MGLHPWELWRWNSRPFQPVDFSHPSGVVEFGEPGWLCFHPVVDRLVHSVDLAPHPQAQFHGCCLLVDPVPVGPVYPLLFQ